MPETGVDPRLRAIRIKTGVAKRIAKERDSYVKEAEQHKAKLEKMKEEGEDILPSCTSSWRRVIMLS